MDTITVINPFEVPEDRESDALALWDQAAAYLERQDGFVSARLHRAIDPAARYRFVTVAQWRSPEHFMAALGNDEMRGIDEQMAQFPHAPALYEVIRT